jgi:hypothetical protein
MSFVDAVDLALNKDPKAAPLILDTAVGPSACSVRAELAEQGVRTGKKISTLLALLRSACGRCAVSYEDLLLHGWVAPDKPPSTKSRAPNDTPHEWLEAGVGSLRIPRWLVDEMIETYRIGERDRKRKKRADDLRAEQIIASKAARR